MTADEIIAALDLQPHPEGGFYRETFRDYGGPDGRARSTAIYYLLRAGEVSRWHRIDSAEVWHFYRGGALELSYAMSNGEIVTQILGAAVEKGERPQIAIPPGAWQRARPLSGCARPSWRARAWPAAPAARRVADRCAGRPHECAGEPAQDQEAVNSVGG